MAGTFEEDLGYILMRFKNGEANYAETTMAVEKCVLDALGFTSYVSKLIAEIEQHYKESPKKSPTEAGD